MRQEPPPLRRRLATWAALVALACPGAAPADTGQPQPRHAGAAVRLVVCPPGPAGPDCDFTRLADALAAAPDGATVVIRPGVYRQAAVLRADRVVVLAEPGAHLVGTAAEGKAALVVKGDDATVEGLECSEIRVPDGNGACVRAEGVNLTLRRVHFHDSQEGILGGRGRIVIEDSTFERLGGDAARGPGQAHAIYIGHQAAELVLRRSRVLASKEEGHEIKSRARRTIIEDNVIASLDGVDSRLIDAPNGGVIVVRGNLLEKGPNSSNPDLIGIGLERGRQPAIDHATNSILVEGNTVVDDRPAGTRFIHAADVAAPVVTGNTLIGGTPWPEGGNRWFADRRAAGLPPYPALAPMSGQ